MRNITVRLPKGMGEKCVEIAMAHDALDASYWIAYHQARSNYKEKVKRQELPKMPLMSLNKVTSSFQLWLMRPSNQRKPTV